MKNHSNVVRFLNAKRIENQQRCCDFYMWHKSCNFAVYLLNSIN